jgi:putative SOS response-associated peptidase YedK
MCGRFALSPRTNEVEHLLPGIKNSSVIKPRFNIAPTQKIAAVLNDNREVITTVIWGLIPSWSKDAFIGNKFINARAETIDEKPSFKYPFRKRRCLILATGFYEWKKGEKNRGKIPYFIKLKSDEVFAFAGLWDSWRNTNGEVINSATIITTSPNKLMEPIHNRMPVIFDKQKCKIWLDSSVNSNELISLLKSYPEELMEAYEVSSLVNNPSFDSPECILPITN